CSVSSWFSSWEKSRSRAARNRTLQVTTTENVALIVPHGIRQTGPAKASGRQTKPVLGAYVALVRQGEAHKIASF
ncbi:MAG: hypothetical protein KDC23_14505, partial [Actinobacteria bacterium]|nr:hypothetical protein [Actinomycetota bacterium]